MVPLDTEATFSLDDFHDSVLFLASVGRICADMLVDLPSSSVRDFWESFNSATGRLSTLGSRDISCSNF